MNFAQTTMETQTPMPLIPGMSMEPGIDPASPLGRLLGISSRLMDGLWFCPAIPPTLCGEICAESKTHNRRMNQSHVKLISTAMAKGAWRQKVGCDIHFHAKGWLANGQHRLAGASKANTPFYAIIHTGLSDRDATAIDQQRKRSPMDVMRISFGETTLLSIRTSVAKAILQYQSGNLDFQMPFDPYDVCEVGYAFSEEEMEILRKTYNARSVLGLLTSVAGALFLIVRKTHKEKLDAFVDLLGSGLTTDKTSPAYIYREFLLSAKSSNKTGGRWERGAFGQVTIRALNLLVTGERITRLLSHKAGTPRIDLVCAPVLGASKNKTSSLLDVK